MVNFAKSPSDLSKTITAFNRISPDHWKELLGSSPIYFVHEQRGEKNLFCLSKVCVVSDFQYTEYLPLRNTFDGGFAQHRISYLTDAEWLPLKKVKPVIRKDFKKWIHSFFPNYNTDKAHIISLNESIKKERTKSKRQQTAADLKARLKLQELIGQIGEEIAFQAEVARLAKTKLTNPESFVELLSIKDVSAGCDIKSFDPKAKRTIYIEVKSSTTEGNREFYISNNEVEFLKEHGKRAYIYLVHVTDVEARTGKVVERIQDPIPSLSLTAESFKAKVKK